MKQCTVCKKAKELIEFPKNSWSKDGYRSECKVCNSAFFRMFYKSNREKLLRKVWLYRQTEAGKRTARKSYLNSITNNPLQFKAYNKVKYAVRTGELQRKNCEECGVTKTQAHHEDYSKPFDVIWLCKKHHMIRHDRWVYAEEYEKGNDWKGF